MKINFSFEMEPEFLKELCARNRENGIMDFSKTFFSGASEIVKIYMENAKNKAVHQKMKEEFARFSEVKNEVEKKIETSNPEKPQCDCGGKKIFVRGFNFKNVEPNKPEEENDIGLTKEEEVELMNRIDKVITDEIENFKKEKNLNNIEVKKRTTIIKDEPAEKKEEPVNVDEGAEQPPESEWTDVDESETPPKATEKSDCDKWFED